MKSRYANMLYAIASGILEDVRMAYPEYRGVDRDLDRLTLLSKTRGLGLFTLDLPALDSALLLGLETGFLHVSGPCSHKVSKSVHIPRFLRGLWMKVFDDNLSLREDVDPTAIAFLRQILCLGKKIEVECKSSRTQKVLDDYYNIEQELREPSLSWSSDSLDLSSHSVHFCDSMDTDIQSVFRKDDDVYSDRELLTCLQQTADDIISQFRSYDPEESTDSKRAKGNGSTGFRHGPGSVADMRGRRGLFDKYDIKCWPTKLQSLFPIEQILHGYPYGSTLSGVDSNEPPSKLIAVPKTAKGPRLIASEPTAHQWCQQGLASFFITEINNVIGNRFIDFRDQSKSARMVSSASRDRRLVTVDLSSASDRLSLWTIERIFRRHETLLTALHAVRTRRINLSLTPSGLCPAGLGEGGDRIITLRKYASQGTGLTFPVQSFVFFLCAVAALRAANRHTGNVNLRSYVGRVRVYGDDIIIDGHGYVPLQRILSLLQLKVNVEKTYTQGSFRESCGSDCFMGYDVTPVKPKRLGGDTPTAVEATVELSNNLFLKGYWHASERARSIIKECDRLFSKRIPVRTISSGLFGYKSFVGEDLTFLKERWNQNYSRFEYRMSAILHKVPTQPVEGRPALLRFFHEGSSAGASTFQRQLAGRGVSRKGYAWGSTDS